MPDQTDLNYRWFRENLPSLIQQHRGSHALLHDCSVAGYFSSSIEAITAGLTKFGEGNFSVEPVDYCVQDLGFYSHVGSTLHA